MNFHVVGATYKRKVKKKKCHHFQVWDEKMLVIDKLVVKGHMMMLQFIYNSNMKK